ncbi:ABC transporter permease [Streptomyces sp. NBC_01304]|uniref:ABC transporter permease n=1 Tax=Streptomyces sp. NBC_01304 TaxID=2903818 RepID=UPI002E105844|nr:FtsX-like permease family protein [Streptomyces sp. NBC_01304]
MSALSQVVRSGAGRRRVQSIVIALAAMMAVAASVLAGSLLVASSGPFDDAFARQHGAHLSVQYAAGAGGEAQLRAGAEAAQVAASAGPFRTTTALSVVAEATVPPVPGVQAPSVQGKATAASGPDSGAPELPMTIVGRAGPDGDVDKLALTDGRWANRPGEIVLAATSGGFPVVGAKVNFPGLPGSPSLRVVGTARSATGTAEAWVTPAQIAALTPPGRAPGLQMLYRFDRADTAAQIAAGRKAVTAGLPAKAVAGSQSWLTVKKHVERDTALYVPFLIAFGVLGLVMSVLIVGNVVAATVGAGLRRIGILKALGFTPAQVVRAYIGQALLPATLGTAVGVLAGHVLAIPILAEAENAYGTSELGIAPWIDAAVIGGVLGLVTVTAWASAARAGRLRTVDALAVGAAPRPARGRWAVRLTGRLPLPRPVGLGLARPFARPARTLAMGTAILFGAAAVTFTVGLGSSLGEIMTARDHGAADVTIGVLGPRHGPGAARDTKPAADPGKAIEAQPGTRAHYGTATTWATVAGASGSTTVTAFTGDASWGGYAMVSGRWLTKPGEAVVPTPLLTTTGKHVGDRLTLNGRKGPVTLRIVGEVLDPRYDGMQIFTDAATLHTAEPDLTPTAHHIALKSGTDAASYTDTLNRDLRPLGLTAQVGSSEGSSEMVVTLNALSALLTLMLVAVAALGVLNSVVLDTRERVRELGIHKALGMTPRQTITMVLTSVVATGLTGGALGVPLGVLLHRWIMPAMGESAGLTLPESVISVFQAPQLLLLGLGGLAIAVLGALLPAGWAARARTAVALRTE